MLLSAICYQTGDQQLAIKVAVPRPQRLAIFGPSHQLLAFKHVGKLATFSPPILASLGCDTNSNFAIATGDQRLAIKVVVSRPKRLALFGNFRLQSRVAIFKMCEKTGDF